MILRACVECATPGDPSKRCRNPKCSRSTPKQRKRPNTPNQKAIKGVGPRGRAWRQTRAKFLSLYPICQWHEGCIAPAHHVHHIDGQGPTGPAGLEFENLMGLCGSHHSQIEANIRRRNELGQWV